LDCPVCENAMITLELADVEIDYCTDCGGIWLDSGELELLLNNPERARKLLGAFRIDKNCTEKARRCPICLKKMQKIIVGQPPAPLLIDKCPRGDGLWFDKGELKEIVEKAQLDEESKIQKLLADMFGEQST